ncbi:hypothetical protein IMCC26134_15245 [Verrucomicrobia bacterium IMCC26134]|jgi:hypothetical protein|nr:hypothetical protein IMCC26134_15245 [Verrucomicrobia bacterium IMCC26134]
MVLSHATDFRINCRPLKLHTHLIASKGFKQLALVEALFPFSYPLSLILFLAVLIDLQFVPKVLPLCAV